LGIADNQLKTFATGEKLMQTVRVMSLISINWTNQRPGRMTTVQNRGSAEPRQLIGVSHWCNLSWLELGSNLWSTLNLVQLNRDLIDVGETRP